MSKMEENIYEETVPAKWMTITFAGITILLFSILLYQVINGPIRAEPAPNIAYLGLTLLFLGVTLNFRKLKIRIDSEDITAGYGIFKNTISWNKVEKTYLDEASTARYGGWGLRIGRVKGNWRIVYNVVSGPRVVVSSKKGTFRELVFSTKKPEEIMKIIEEKRE